jgi:4-amino-4-deoxy-L-arabinose transferase-like glycosyltransferase
MKIIAAIFVLSFVIQIAVMNVAQENYQPELYEYENIARNLLTRQTFVSPRLGTEYYSLTPPLYPMLCALTYLLTNHSHLAMLFVQIILTCFTGVFVYLIAKEIFNKRIGIISAVLCIFHPGLIIYSTTKLHELSLVAFLFSLLTWIILKFEKDITYKRSFTVGFLIGICILTRATIVAFIPLFLLWLFLYRKYIFRTKRDFWLKSFFIIFIAGIVILPWVIRNYSIHRQFIFMQTPAADLWVGNNINASGTNYLEDGRPVFESMPKDFINKIFASDELTQDRIFKEAVYRFIKEHPDKFILLFFKKLYYFWWFSPQAGIKYQRIYLLIYKLFYSAILFFSICGIISVLIKAERKVIRETSFILLLFLAISIMQSLFYVEGRHRWAIEPLLLIFTANGLISGTDAVKNIFNLKRMVQK